MSEFLYIDPGSGSYLVQVIIASLLGIVFYFRNIVTSLSDFFRRMFGRNNGSSNQ